jgi:hypothetical protein
MNKPIEIVLGSIAGVALILYTGLYFTKRKTEQRQNGLILPRQASIQNPLVEYEDGVDLPDTGSNNPNDFRKLLYGGKTKSKKQSKKNK